MLLLRDVARMVGLVGGRAEWAGWCDVIYPAPPAALRQVQFLIDCCQLAKYVFKQGIFYKRLLWLSSRPLRIFLF